MKRFTILFVCALFLAANAFAQNDRPIITPTTTMEFQDSQYDFGKINQGDVVKTEYTFTNTGTEPLVLTNAKGSCGCTVPKWPKQPIMPGESGVIKVEFNSKGKKGIQSKRVTITANTDPVQTFLTIKGEILVVEGEEKTEIARKENSQQIDRNKTSAKDCFAIFPNPTTDVLKLDLKEHQGESVDIKILNSTGSIMTRRKVERVAGIIEFQVRDYISGTYYVNIQVGREAPSTKCFVVMGR